MADENIKIVRDKLQNQDEVELFDSDRQGALPPLGGIIAVHSNANFDDIDSDFWVLCDGSSADIVKPDGTTLSVTLPDLTDDRMLMGGVGTSGGASDNGGNNGSHYHTGGDIAATTGQPEQGGFGSWLGNHSHQWSGYNGETSQRDGNPNDIAVSNPGLVEATTSTPNTVAHIHTDFTLDGGVLVGNLSGFDGDVADSNLPQYYKVKYYMRIK